MTNQTRNRTTKPVIIYLAGFRQHAGKTLTALGLLSVLRQRFDPAELGYIKPVGQELTELPDGRKVDKDAIIIREFSRIPDLDPGQASPVRLAAGFTRDFLASADPTAETQRLTTAILDSVATLAHKRVIVAEGTGHPGVGGIVGLSNAAVSRLIGAEVIYLSEGGIGRALDTLEVDLNYFLHQGSSVRGVIFNKLIPEKIPTLRTYITETLLQRHFPFPEPLRIFGFLPKVDEVSRPSMEVIRKRFRGARAIGSTDTAAWRKPCTNLRVISVMSEFINPEAYIKPGDIVLLAASSQSRRSKILAYNRILRQYGPYLGGIILTYGSSIPLDPQIEDEVARSGIPALYVQEDTATAEEKILHAFETTKLQTYDTDKIVQIEKLFQEHFDVDRFLSVLDERGDG